MRVFIKTYGCSTNQADGEVLAGCLTNSGIQLANSLQAADVLIYNCCAVKGPTEDRAVEALKRLPIEKKLIVAGCLPLINLERLRREVRFDGVVGPAAGERIVEVVKRVTAGEKVDGLNGGWANAMPTLSLPRCRSNRVVSVVPVNNGCLGSCAYCCVVFARGHLRSYSISEIVERVKSDLAAGAREFWVTSQDTGCYGRDVGSNLPMLLEALCGLEGDFKLRVGMMTPNHASLILNDLIHAFENAKVYKFLHLPVQSGDDIVLKRMRRFYTAREFRETVEAFRKTLPEITLATDVICGFPGETREAFGKTLKLIGDVKPDIVNVSKFFARPKTLAAEMGDVVEKAEIKRRSAEMARLTKQISLERNRRWIDWVGEVLINEKGKVSGSWVGRNFAYKPVAVRSSRNLLGKTLRVKVAEAFPAHLHGELA